LELAVKHAEAGYRNAQDIIKFLDTKSGVIAGFAFVGIGLILQVLKEFIEARDSVKTSTMIFFENLPHSTLLIIVFITTFSLLCGIASIYYVVRCITARPPSDISELKHTFLFPFFDEKCDLESAMEHYKKINDGFTLVEVAQEYEAQLLQVGSIICKKVKYNRLAANCFLGQLTFLAATALALLIQLLTCSR
jgi:hypothetical protein